MSNIYFFVWLLWLYSKWSSRNSLKKIVMMKKWRPINTSTLRKKNWFQFFNFLFCFVENSLKNRFFVLFCFFTSHTHFALKRFFFFIFRRFSIWSFRFHSSGSSLFLLFPKKKKIYQTSLFFAHRHRFLSGLFVLFSFVFIQYLCIIITKWWWWWWWW